MAAQKVFSYLLTLRKIASAPNNPKIPSTKKARGTLYMLKYYHESQISLRFALRSLVFQIIEVFDFPIGYNGEFKIFEKKNR